MMHERTKDINVMAISYSESDRYLKPTRAAIDAMKKSLAMDGQINPISLYPVTLNKYRLIAGATRFVAAMELGWKTIRASVFSGSAIDFQIYELIENVERRELGKEQRADMKARIRQLQSERLAKVEPAKGGRGHKGGVSDEARQMGVPRTTALRRQQEAKPAHIPKSGQVSEPATAAPTTVTPRKPTQLKHKIQADITDTDFALLRAWSDAHSMNLAEAVRTIVHEYLAGQRTSPPLRVVQ